MGYGSQPTLHQALARRIPVRGKGEDPSDALAALGRVSLLTFNIDEKTAVTRLPKPDQHQRSILDALKVSLPAK